MLLPCSLLLLLLLLVLLPSSLLPLLLLVLVLFFLPPSFSDHNPCSSSSPPCPPFLSAPPFPFSFTPGCGHPSFLLHCSASANHSLLTISSTRFPLLRFHHRTSSLLLRPSRLPLNLSHSPFRLSCSSLPPHHPHLLCSPLLLVSLHPSHSHSHSPSPPPPVLLSWNPLSDPYFSLCSSSCHRGSCGYDASSPSLPFLCFPPSPLPPSLPLLLILLPSLLSLAFLVSLALLLYRHFCPSPTPPISTTSSSFDYDYLLAATDGFSPARKLGDGGFGSVFLADLGAGAGAGGGGGSGDEMLPAAVKRLHHASSPSSSRSFRNEVLILSSLRHPNLIRLRGHCCDPRGLLLVYDYAPNGTLADHLHGNGSAVVLPPMTWRARVDAAVQVASALEYLHFSVTPPVVHRDVTSSNIFVDGDMRVRLGDFGLSRLLLREEDPAFEGFVRTGPQGTPGYLDPDYYRFFRLTDKSDVYSFGVVLLELITGMKAIDPSRVRGEVELADLVVSRIQLGELRAVVDPAIVREPKGNFGTVEAVAELAFRCLVSDKDDRPNSREVSLELRRIRDQVTG